MSLLNVSNTVRLKGVVGVEFRVHYKDNKWKAKKVKETWMG